MNELERAQRATAWIWAAELLGQEVTTERIAGLVEVTARVHVENLKPALQACITTQTSGFLPSPGAVIDAGSRVAAKRREADQDAARGAERSKVLLGSGEEQDAAVRDSTAWWRAFVVRQATDHRFKLRAQQARKQRHAWAAQHTWDTIGKRRVSNELWIQMRQENNTAAEAKFPRPDPFEGGWTPPPGADPIKALVGLTTA